MASYETIHDRIKHLVEEKAGGKNTVFAQKLGVSEANIRGYMKGVIPKADVLEKIVTSYEINAKWLLTGEGEMMQTDDSRQAQTAWQVPKDSGKGIPLIPLDAVAGFPTDSGAAVLMEDCERYVIPEFENKGANFLIRVSGDSMVPLYYSGDLLACRKIDNVRFFQWGTVYVLETSQGVIVKRVQESQDHDDSILCVSENSSIHRPFLLPRDDIRSLSIIVGLVRLV